MRSKTSRFLSIVALLAVTIVAVHQIFQRLAETQTTRAPADETGKTWIYLTPREELEKLETDRFGKLDNDLLTQQCRAMVEEVGFELSGKIRRPESQLEDMWQHRQNYLERLKHFVREYERVSEDEPLMKAKAAASIDAYMQTEARVRSDLTIIDLEESFRAVIDAGVKDPFPVAIHTYLDSRPAEDPTNHFVRKALKIRECALTMRSQKYSPEVVQFVSYLSLLALDKSIPGGITREEFVGVFSDSFCDDLANCDGTNKSLAIHAEILANRIENIHFASILKVYEKILKDSRINDVLVAIAAGHVHIRYGWEMRTEQVASKVSEKRWSEFHQHLHLAKVYLKKAWLLKPNISRTTTALMTISMAGEEDFSTRDWFKLATQANFEDAVAYRKFANSILPKWGGSEEEIYDFAKECFQTRAFGTVVPVQCFSAIDLLATDYPEEKLWESSAVKEIVQLCADELDQWLDTEESKGVREESLADIKAWLLSMLVINKDFERAGRLLRRIRCQPTPGIISNFIKEPELASGRALAFSGSYSTNLQQIDENFVANPVNPLTKQADFADTLSVLKKADEETTFPEEKRYLKTVSSLMPAYQEFCCNTPPKGNVQFDPELTTWIFQNGSGKFVADNQIVVHQSFGNDTRLPVLTAFRHRFRVPYRLRATIQIPTSIKPENFSTNGNPPIIQIERRQEDGFIQKHTMYLKFSNGEYKLDLEIPATGPARLNDPGNRSLTESNVTSEENRLFDGRIWIGVIHGATIRDVTVEQLSQSE